MNIKEYAKSSEPLEKREEALFETVKKLDSDSFRIFKEVIDLNNTSLYKVEDLVVEINELSLAYHNTIEALEYLQKIEQSSRPYYTGRFLLRIAGSLLLTACVSLISPLFGIIPLITLNRKAIEQYGEDIKENLDKLDDFDYSKDKILRTINVTLDNSERLLFGKNNRAKKLDNFYYILELNNYIKNYLDGIITIEEIMALPDYIKHNMCTILSSELDIQSNDLEELLNEAKSRHSDSMKLLKEYK